MADRGQSADQEGEGSSQVQRGAGAVPGQRAVQRSEAGGRAGKAGQALCCRGVVTVIVVLAVFVVLADCSSPTLFCWHFHLKRQS